ncbi:MAG: PEFG-CTERM sorting domain-containing protein [Nitrosopumilus sp.]|nr:PEFG-CTERM sorting domain-containing protein [Nitrosopumilus sp.]MBL7017852.1 PEFG-CTERM sorting domain-containing protein [Nitrosopumilus sp.]
MDLKIFYGFIALLIVSTGVSFAQEALISIETDDNNYDEGDTIVLSGNVNIVIGDTPVILQLFNQGNLVDIAQITVAEDGSFTKAFLAEGALWKKTGDYTIVASYQEHQIETEFSYTSKSEAVVTTEPYEVDAGSHGTFDVKYTIKGGTVKNMIVDSETFAVIVQIDASDEGTITLDLPREFIGAEKQDGKDDTFIILIDGIEVAYQESVVLADSRVITIEFEQGDSDIEIIGTYVVPEFGAIVMMVLIVGIMMTILVARNKFQISI